MAEESVQKSFDTVAYLKMIRKANRKKFFLKHKKLFVALGVLIIFLFLTKIITGVFFFTIDTMDEANMSNTINIGDKVCVDKNFSYIETGKIYELKKEGKIVISRCIGVGGDHIIVNNDDVYVNGVLLSSHYVSSKMKSKINIDVTVPKGKIFVLGDNRNSSWDSRYWENKFVNEHDLIGEVTKIVYPFDRAKKIK